MISIFYFPSRKQKTPKNCETKIIEKWGKEFTTLFLFKQEISVLILPTERKSGVFCVSLTSDTAANEKTNGAFYGIHIIARKVEQ